MISSLLAADSLGMFYWHQILMIILFRCWVYMFVTKKVPEVKNIGLASIEAVWPQLDQNSIVMCKSTLHAKFQVILSIGGRFTALPVRESGLCPPPFGTIGFFKINMI